MQDSWDGKPRRAADFKANDHDTVVTLVQIMSNHVENFNRHREDFESLSKKFDQHREDDTKEFNGIKKNLWTAAGALSCFVFLINLFFKH